MAADVSHGVSAGVPPAAPRVPPARKGWTPGRVVSLVAGSILSLVCVVLLGGAGILTWADQEQQGGYLPVGAATYSTGGYVRIRVIASSPGTPVFVAIGPAGDVSRYLAGVSYTSVTALGGHDVTQHLGNVRPDPPSTVLNWAAEARGTGTQTLQWTVRSGDWMMVVMNPDGSRGVTVRADLGVSSPVLPWLAGELLTAGVLAGLTGAALVVIPARLAAGRR